MRQTLMLLLALALPATSFASTTTTFIAAQDGVQIAVHHYARDTGPTRATPVLLVHGTWGDSRTWTFPGRSCVDYLTQRGYDVFAVDLRGMGDSFFAASYFAIGLPERTQDVAAAGGYVAATTGHKPVVIGWSQGGVVAALAAAAAPDAFAGIGLFGVPAHGFHVDPALVPVIQSVVASGADRWLPPPEILFAGIFGFDPVTGAPTIGADAFAQFVALSEPDSLNAILQEASPDFWAAAVTPRFASIQIPALVVAGAKDAFVLPGEAQAVYDLLGSKDKDLVLLGRNAHGFFLEDDFNATQRVFDAFLAKF
jgi:pimeloyl-ACP methyl ester carboxylesterase